MPSKEQHVLGHHRDHADTDVRQEESGAIVQLRQDELAARKQIVEAGQAA